MTAASVPFGYSIADHFSSLENATLWLFGLQYSSQFIVEIIVFYYFSKGCLSKPFFQSIIVAIFSMLILAVISFIIFDRVYFETTPIESIILLIAIWLGNKISSYFKIAELKNA